MSRRANAIGQSPWTSPRDVTAELERRWDRGQLLQARVGAEALSFPLRVRLRKPSAAELAERFVEVRAWIAMLSAASASSTDGPAGAAADDPAAGYRIEWREARNRTLGTNRVPHRLWVDSLDDALAVVAGSVGQRRVDATVAAFDRVVAAAKVRRPTLVPWAAGNAWRAVELDSTWDALLDVVDWIEAHPHSGLYLRQIDVASVDTKFIERHRAILTELLDIAAPKTLIDAEASGVRRFDRRYGFKVKPLLIRLRSLDPAAGLLGLLPQADLTLDAASFANLAVPEPLAAGPVIMIENEVNFLSFPPVEGAIAVWTAGYGLERFQGAAWLAKRHLLYWGDIDTNGFAILDDLRGRFPHVESFLMGRATLDHHRTFWGTESSPVDRDLPRLTVNEAALYDDLRSGALSREAAVVRLEQERIRFSWIESNLTTKLEAMSPQP